MKERKYNHYRVRDLVLSVVLLVYVLWNIWELSNTSKSKPGDNFVIIIVVCLFLIAIVLLLDSYRYKAYAKIGPDGIRVFEKNNVLASITWDKVVSYQYYNPWGGVKGPKYTVLFTKNATILDPKLINVKQQMIDKHMLALYKKRISAQEFEALEVLIFWSLGKEDTDEIVQMMNDYKQRNLADDSLS